MSKRNEKRATKSRPRTNARRKGRLVVILAASALFMIFHGQASHPVPRQATDPQPTMPRPAAQPIETDPEHAVLRIAPERIKPGRANFFSFTPQAGKEIRFFVVDLANGEYRASLDTCAGCYRDGLAYTQTFDHLVCRKCGHRVPFDLSGSSLDDRHPLQLAVESNGDVRLSLAEVLDLAKQYTPAPTQ